MHTNLNWCEVKIIKCFGWNVKFVIDTQPFRFYQLHCATTTTNYDLYYWFEQNSLAFFSSLKKKIFLIAHCARIISKFEKKKRKRNKEFHSCWTASLNTHGNGIFGRLIGDSWCRLNWMVAVLYFFFLMVFFSCCVCSVHTSIYPFIS